MRRVERVLTVEEGGGRTAVTVGGAVSAARSCQMRRGARRTAYQVSHKERRPEEGSGVFMMLGRVHRGLRPIWVDGIPGESLPFPTLKAKRHLSGKVDATGRRAIELRT